MSGPVNGRTNWTILVSFGSGASAARSPMLRLRNGSASDGSKTSVPSATSNSFTRHRRRSLRRAQPPSRTGPHAQQLLDPHAAERPHRTTGLARVDVMPDRQLGSSARGLPSSLPPAGGADRAVAEPPATTPGGTTMTTPIATAVERYQLMPTELEQMVPCRLPHCGCRNDTPSFCSELPRSPSRPEDCSHASLAAARPCSCACVTSCRGRAMCRCECGLSRLSIRPPHDPRGWVWVEPADAVVVQEDRP